jgi:hypothetical protein
MTLSAALTPGEPAARPFDLTRAVATAAPCEALAGGARRGFVRPASPLVGFPSDIVRELVLGRLTCKTTTGPAERSWRSAQGTLVHL